MCELLGHIPGPKGFELAGQTGRFDSRKEKLGICIVACLILVRRCGMGSRYAQLLFMSCWPRTETAICLSGGQYNISPRYPNIARHSTMGCGTDGTED